VEIYRSNSRRLVENWDLTLVPEHLRSAVDFQSTVEKLAAYTLEMVEELAEWRLDLLARGYVPEKPGSWKEPKVVVPVSKKPKEIMETVKISLASVAEVAPYLSYPPVSGSLTTMKEVEAFRKASRKALKEMDLTRVPETMRSAKNFQTILNGFSLHAMEIVEQQCQAAIDYHHLTPVYNPLEYVEAIEQCAGEFQTALRELGEREQVEADALTHKFTHSKRTPDPEVIQEKFATLRLKFETRRAKLSAKYEKLQAKLEEKATKAAAKAEKAAAKLAKLEEKAAAKLAKLEEKAAKAAAKAERQPKSRAKVVTEVAPQPTEPTAKALARAAKEAEKAEKAAAKAAKAAANAVKLVQKGAEVLDEGSWKNREFRPTIEPEAEQELQEYADSMGIPVDHQLVEARRFFLYIHSRGASLWASVECALNFAKAEGLDVLGALERNTPKSRGHVTATLCRPMYDMGFSHQFDRLTNEQKVDVKNAYEVVHAHNVTAANFDRLTTYEKGVLTYHFLYETGNFSKKCREISGGC
jgi:chemotaxis protein histidine kinase CheA